MREVHRHAFRVHGRDLHTLAEVLHERAFHGYGRVHHMSAEEPYVRVHRGHDRDHRRLGDALHVLRVRVFHGHARGCGIPLVGAGCGRNWDYGCVRPLRGGRISAG